MEDGSLDDDYDDECVDFMDDGKRWYSGGRFSDVL